MEYLKIILLTAIILLVYNCNSVAIKTEPIESEPTTQPTSGKPTTHNVSWNEVTALGKLPYDYLIPYGDDFLQFGELRIPEGSGPFPTVVYIHGGCWLSAYDLDYVSAVCADLVKEGYAVWTPEYRRVGDEGGAYPNTFTDIQLAINYLRDLKKQFPLNIERTVVMGHSAGGHLALWMAAQKKMSKNSPFYNSNPLPLKGVISLAGITDLAAYDAVGNDCSTAVIKLMDGNATEQLSRYEESSPILLLPTGVPTRLIHGDLDPIVPIAQSETFAAKAQEKGDDTKILTVKGGSHFDMASPYSAAWGVVKTELKNLME